MQLRLQAGGAGGADEPARRQRDVVGCAVHADPEAGAVGDGKRGADRVVEVRLDGDERAARAQEPRSLGERRLEWAVVGDVVQDEPVQDDVEGRVGQHVERARRADHALVGVALADGEARAIAVDVGRDQPPAGPWQQVAARMPATSDGERVAAADPEVTVQQLALAPLAALVLFGERRGVAEPVEQVVGRVDLAQAAKATVVLTIPAG